MLRFGVHQLSLSFGRATGGNTRNRGANTLWAVQGVVAVPRLVRAAGTMWQVRPGERLEFQAVGEWWAGRTCFRDLLSCMKHPCRLIPRAEKM
jgi:hypothetical protein